jgi:membrane-anchored mycosin MYCP
LIKPWVILGAVALSFPLAGVAPGLAKAEDQTCDTAKTNYVDETPAAFAQLGITAAQRLSDGNVRVAVVDSEVDAKSAHLGGVVDAGKSFIGPGDGRVDTFGQGTAIAGQIAAREVPGSGVLGIAPKARIVPVRVYESEDSGKANPSVGKTADGIRWAAQQAGVRVIVVPQNLSTTTDDPNLKSAVMQATKAGVLVVAAAGDVTNGQPSDPVVRFPAGYPAVLSVTALGADGKVASNAQNGAYVGLAAPGAQVLTAFRSNGDCLLAGSQASTSYAAGYAAGIAVLVAAAHPDESPEDWHYRMLVTALRPTTDQRNNATGWGVIAAYDAINFVNDGSRLGPTNPRFPTPAAPPALPGQQPSASTDNGSASGVVASIGLSALVLVLAAVLIDLLWHRRNQSNTPGDSQTTDRN